MKNTSDIFFNHIKNEFAPALRGNGFKGSGRTFRRICGECVHLINLQTSQSGSKCAVNLALNFSFLPNVDLSKTKQEECDFRRRLTPDPMQSDFWWYFGDDTLATTQSVQNLKEVYESHGASFFERFGNFPGVYREITIEDLIDSKEDKLPGGTTTSRYALFFARMWIHLKDYSKARVFADYGFESCGPMAASIRAQFKIIIKDIELKDSANL